MKKNKLYKSIILSFLIIFSISSCKNFLTGQDSKFKIDESIRIQNCKKYNVRFSPLLTEYGYFEVNSQISCYESQEIEVAFVANQGYECIGFSVVDRKTQKIIPNNYFESSPIQKSLSTKGNYKYTSTLKILKLEDNLQIIPVCLKLDDKNAPTFYKENENYPNFLIANSSYNYENETYISLDQTYDKWDDENKFIISKLYVTLNGYDDNSNINGLSVIIKETFIKTLENTYINAVKISELPQKLLLIDANTNLYSSTIEYSPLQQKEGIYCVEFYLKDELNNISTMYKKIYFKYIKSFSFSLEPLNINDITNSQTYEEFQEKISEFKFNLETSVIPEKYEFYGSTNNGKDFIPLDSNIDSNNYNSFEIDLNILDTYKSDKILIKGIMTTKYGAEIEGICNLDIPPNYSEIFLNTNRYCLYGYNNLNRLTFNKEYLFISDGTDLQLYTARYSILYNFDLTDPEKTYYIYNIFAYNSNAFHPFRRLNIKVKDLYNISNNITQSVSCNATITQNQEDPNKFDINIEIPSFDDLQADIYYLELSSSTSDPIHSSDTYAFPITQKNTTIYGLYDISNSNKNLLYIKNMNYSNNSVSIISGSFSSINNINNNNIIINKFDINCDYPHAIFTDFTSSVEPNNISVYISNEKKKRTLDEIMSLENIPLKKLNTSYYIDCSQIPEDEYIFYFYNNINNTYEEYTFNLLPIYLYKTGGKINNTTTQNLLPEYKSLIPNVKSRMLVSDSWEENSNITHQKFKKYFSFFTIDSCYYFSYPVYYYDWDGLTYFESKIKSVTETDDSLCIYYDQPIFIDKLYNSRNLGDNPDLWEAKTPESQKKVSVIDSSIDKDNILSYTYLKNYNYIPKNNYCCTIVHFADGTSIMSSVKYISSEE